MKFQRTGQFLVAAVGVALLAAPAAVAQYPTACCLPDCTCVELDYMDCVLQGGFPQGPFTPAPM
jgi:hypothetical protein